MVCAEDKVLGVFIALAHVGDRSRVRLVALENCLADAVLAGTLGKCWRFTGRFTYYGTGCVTCITYAHSLSASLA